MSEEINEEYILELLFSVIEDPDQGSLIRKIENEHVIFTKVGRPSIIPQTISEDTIILVQKCSNTRQQKLSSKGSTYTSTPGKGDSSNKPSSKFSFEDDLNITGSPLKCHFNIEMNMSSPFIAYLDDNEDSSQVLPYTPLPTVKAIKIFSKINFALRKSKTENLLCPIWVVCDASDFKKTLLLGLHYDGSMTSMSSLTTSGPHATTEDLPSIDVLTAEVCLGCPSTRVESSGRAEYDVTTSTENSKCASSKSLVQLQCSWRHPTSILSYPAPDATSFIDLKICCLDVDTKIMDLFQELKVLKGLIQGITTGEIVWFMKCDKKSVKEELSAQFNRLREQGPSHKITNKTCSDGKEVFYNVSRSLSFTDMLWTVLMKCQSYQELVECLNIVFDAITTGYIRPQIHVRNVTQIGCEARSLMKGETRQVQLTDSTPLQMLIEIGIEKLKSDYMHKFYVGKLATAEQLSCYVEGASNLSNPTSCMNKLEQLHITLHTIVVILNYFQLPDATLTEYTSKIFKTLNDNSSIEDVHSFNFPVQTNCVKDNLRRLQPKVWEVTMNNNDEKNMTKQLICQISHNKLLFKDEEDLKIDFENENMNQLPYYCAIFTQTRDNLFL